MRHQAPAPITCLWVGVVKHKPSPASVPASQVGVGKDRLPPAPILFLQAGVANNRLTPASKPVPWVGAVDVQSVSVAIPDLQVGMIRYLPQHQPQEAADCPTKESQSPKEVAAC